MTKWALSAFSTLLLAGCSTLPFSERAYEAVSAGALNGYRLVSHYELGKNSLRTHNYGNAITSFLQELDRNPNSIAALNGLAIAYTQIGREDVANDYWERALALNPDSVVTLNNLAYLNLTRGDRETALAYANQAKTQAAAAGNVGAQSSIASVIANNIAAASGQPVEALSAPNDIVFSSETDVQLTNGVERIGDSEWQLRTAAEGDVASAEPVRTAINAPTSLIQTIVRAPDEQTALVSASPEPTPVATPAVQTQAAVASPVAPSTTVVSASPEPEIVVAPTVQTAAVSAPIEPETVANTAPEPTTVVAPAVQTPAEIVTPVAPTTVASAPVEPARTVIAQSTKVTISDDIFLRISNGAGRDDMARRFAGFISEYGAAPNLIANAQSFDYRISYVFYNPGLLGAAQQIAAVIPIPIKLIEAKRGLGSIEIVLGSDLLAFDDRLLGA